jgi:hypothetical protein
MLCVKHVTEKLPEFKPALLSGRKRLRLPQLAARVVDANSTEPSLKRLRSTRLRQQRQRSSQRY